MEKRKILTFEADTKLYELVEKLAKKHERSKGYVLRKILENFSTSAKAAGDFDSVFRVQGGLSPGRGHMKKP